MCQAAEAVVATQSGLTVIGSYLYPYEAHLAKSQLEAGGIEAWVLDEHQVQMRWHLAGALGGVKVAVAPADASAASELLQAPPVPESETSASSEGECPSCGSSAVESRRELRSSPVRVAASVVVSFLTGGLVPIRKHDVTHHCRACGSVWRSASAA